MDRIVITGATSLLGTALIDECIKQNIEVLAICNRNSKNICRITRHELVTITECELSELAGFQTEGQADFYGYDALIHLAWASTGGDAARNELQPQVKNIQYSLDAVDLAERLGCKVFIGAGSQAEYGRTEKVLTEEIDTRPETAYGMAKLCAGQMTRLACMKKGIRHIWTRICSSYGPRYQLQTVLNYTLLELMQGRSPALSGGDQIWDFIYSGDVARAFILLAEKGRDGEIYIIGSGCAKPLKEFLFAAREILEKMEGHELPALGLGLKPYSDTAVMHLACDISKLKRDTGFCAEVSFEEGITRTIEWLKEQNQG